MKRVLLVFIFVILFTVNKTQATNISKYSDDYKIQSALELLDKVGSNDVFDRLNKTKSKIIFYDLTMIDYSYANLYAIATTDEYGENFILINSKYQNSPKEAIACLIAHESVHVLPQATFEEEVKATTIEAQTWLKVGNNISNSNDKLVQREIRLANTYKASTPNNNLIAQAISTNNFYKTQLAK